jgi:hypothetical protein
MSGGDRATRVSCLTGTPITGLIVRVRTRDPRDPLWTCMLPPLGHPNGWGLTQSNLLVSCALATTCGH